MSYPTTSRAYRATRLCGLLGAALALPGCGVFNFNPNIEQLWKPDAETYMVEGAVTRGFASFPRIGYVQGEGNGVDKGSFRITGQQGAGIDNRGIYIPSEIISVDSDNRWKKTFRVPSRYGLIRIFAWDDINRNAVRDLNEQLAGEWELKKEDQRGWSYNAPNWNLFNFSFTK